jgi:hypothetical protein
MSTGGALVWDRLLFAIDQFESGQAALGFVAGVATANDASVRVLHIREVPRMAGPALSCRSTSRAGSLRRLHCGSARQSCLDPGGFTGSPGSPVGG